MRAHWFPFRARHWLSSRAIELMTPAEEGAYIRLLASAWLEDDCGLPDDDDSLAVLSRLGKRVWRKGSGAKLRARFVARNGRLYDDTLLECLKEQDSYHDAKRRAGRKGAERRWQKDGSAIAMPMAENGVSSSSTLVRHPSAMSSPPTPSPSPADDAAQTFQEFRRQAEVAGMSGSGPDWQEAMLEWRRLDFEQRLAAISGIRDRSGNRDDPALSALPKNYLGRRMWERKVRQPAKSKREELWEQV